MYMTCSAAYRYTSLRISNRERNKLGRSSKFEAVAQFREQSTTTDCPMMPIMYEIEDEGGVGRITRKNLASLGFTP
jgi:hypothetical protein